MYIKIAYLFFLFLALGVYPVCGQKAYFVDGFHGGVWGHYPGGYTQFILNELDEHPEWVINLEIEPETWDRVKNNDFDSYQRFKKIFEDQSAEGRIEYVNPSYAQSYFFNTSGESIIRQFHYGIKKIKDHFPNAVFSTYSSEEPCFTSSLPQILSSFGFKNASLKNPNTCWGGYTRANGGELVNWIGPDGTGIVSVPRYEFERLRPGKTWETIANNNSKEFIEAAFDYGVEHPVGMCLQDAGWEWGPWLRGEHYRPTEYTTWRNYFENIANHDKMIDWKFDQEDVLVSLVWGSQVLQKLAQNVRFTENNLVQAEKIAFIKYLAHGDAYPSRELDEAWRTLLLSQHHDCWIVPYNSENGTTWAEKVRVWTASADEKSEIIKNSEASSLKSDRQYYLKIYNTLATERNEYVETFLPEDWTASEVRVVDETGKTTPSQVQFSGDANVILFKANVPPFGYRVFSLKKGGGEIKSSGGAKIEIASNGDYIMETDLYKITIDPSRGGALKSLIAKKLDKKEFVDQTHERKFNELRGHFYNRGGFLSSTEKEASIEILEEGPLQIRTAIKGTIAGNEFTHTIILKEGQERIDFKLKINWQNNIGIGEFEETDYRAENPHKAFYNDQYKLLTLFPLNLENQKLFKNAPFDVLQSELNDTFFSRWDSIKNNLIVNWVDVTDGVQKYGCALYTDHTTSYAHGKDFPLGLNTQYSGVGLWGKDYEIDGPTEFSYSLLPHKGSWREAGLWKESEKINEPLHGVLTQLKPEVFNKSLVTIKKKGWILSSSTMEGEDLLVRIFNAEGDGGEGEVSFGFFPGDVELIELNGEELKQLDLIKEERTYSIRLTIPQFGFRTIRFSDYSTL